MKLFCRFLEVGEKVCPLLNIGAHRRLLAIAAVLITGVTVSSFGVESAGATGVTRWVNLVGTPVTPGTSCEAPGYLTIAAAVTAASAGDTIQVCAGTYPEGLINLDKQGLTLRGAKWGVDARSPRGPSGASGEETILSSSGRIFNLNAEDLTIDGFVFSNLGNRALDSFSYINGLTIKNTIFRVTGISAGSGAIQFGGGSGGSGLYTANGFTFERNYLTGTGSAYVLYLSHQMSGGTIRDNVFNSPSLSFGPFGKPDGWIIDGNTFAGDIAGVNSKLPGAPVGSYVGYGFNAQFGDAIIRNNVVSKMYLGIGQVSLVGGQIVGNTFDDNYAGAFQLWGGEFGSPVSRDVIIANNLFSYNGTDYSSDNAGFLSHAFRIRPDCSAAGPCTDQTTPNAASIQVIRNRFNDLNLSNGKTQVWAIRNNMLGAVDAEFNYWGSEDATVIASKIGKSTSDLGSGLGDSVPWIKSYVDDPLKSDLPGFWPINISITGPVEISVPPGAESVIGDESLGSPTIAFGAPDPDNPVVVTFVATTNPPLPAGVTPFDTSTAVFVDIEIVSGDPSGPFKVCIETAVFTKLFHFVGGSWLNITDDVQPVLGVLCGTTNSLSPFAAGSELPVVSATVSVKNKTYNGSTTGTIIDCVLTGVDPNDVVTCDFGGASATFTSPEVGRDISVDVTGLALAGEDAENYFLAGAGNAFTEASISKLTIVGRIPFNFGLDPYETAELPDTR